MYSNANKWYGSVLAIDFKITKSVQRVPFLMIHMFAM